MTPTAGGLRSRPAHRWLLRCGAAAGPLFISVFTIEGARRADYKPLRHPVSSLALGTRGWVQVVNFAATGMLYLAGAVGLSRASDSDGCGRLGPVALGLAGVGLLGSAAFRTDPVSGYPPGTLPTPTEPTAAGSLHTVAALPIFLGIPAVALASALRFHRVGRQGRALYSAATSLSMLTGMRLFGAGFGQASPRLTDHAGLFQRATIVSGFAWLTALSVRALLQPPVTAETVRSLCREALCEDTSDPQTHHTPSTEALDRTGLHLSPASRGSCRTGHTLSSDRGGPA